MYYTLYELYYVYINKHYTVYCAIHNTYKLYTVHCTLYNVHYALHIIYTVHCTVYNVQCTMYSMQCTLYTAYCTLYIVHCTLYTVHCTVYSVQCIVYSITSCISVNLYYQVLIHFISTWEEIMLGAQITLFNYNIDVVIVKHHNPGNTAQPSLAVYNTSNSR